MASSVEQEPVFIITTMGTRIAVPVSPITTSGDFKKEFERDHLRCFPSMGEIKVSGLKVRHRSYFYHLPNSVPIRHTLHGLKGKWFLHVEAASNDHTVNPSPDLSAHQEQNSSTTCSSQAASVTGIIERYFSNSNEMNRIPSSPLKKARTVNRGIFDPKTPQNYGTLEKTKSCGIGKRILVASNGLQVSKQRPGILLSRYKSGESHGFGARTLVFEVSESED